MEHLLEVKNLSVSIDGPAGEVQAVRDVSFSLKKGEVLAIVGESGCGKSVLCKSIMKLLPPSAKIKEGSICVNGQDITCYREKEMQKLRGRVFSMIFQDPMTSLNPVLTVGDQIAEVLDLHKKYRNKEEVESRVDEILKMVGLPPERKNDYPHQFSGGMKQRIVIAIALACEPLLLLADEPTTALDVTIQAQVLALMDELKQNLNTAMILITHDLGVVAKSCDRVAIMYAGEIIETGTVEQIFSGDHHHPYTVGLFESIPDLKKKTRRLHPIDGLMPDPTDLPEGCKFHTRCPQCMDICKNKIPSPMEKEGHVICCHLYNETTD